MDYSKILIVGANGQLGKSLQKQYPKANKVDISELDITNRNSVLNFDWSKVSCILNAAAYTNVDGAELSDGRISAWKVNAKAVSYLSEVANLHDLKLFHISTDYVFNGSVTPHLEDEDFSPLSVYGASKAAGDIAASLAKRHYILRTSWVIGDGKNFVRTMLELAKKGVDPSVVSDQIGRLTFTNVLVQAIDHLLSKELGAGTYNVSNSGDPASWFEITKEIFQLAGSANKVSSVSTEEYYKNKPEAAKRPLNSTLDLSKIESTGFKSEDWRVDLKNYINMELSQ